VHGIDGVGGRGEEGGELKGEPADVLFEVGGFAGEGKGD
jgi:hypothetical protein